MIQKILEDTYLIKTPFSGLWSGCFFFTGEKNIMVDTGATAEVADEVIVPALAEIGYRPEDIDFVINTHCHGDHTGGNRRMLELSGKAKMAAFELAKDKIENPLKYGRAIRLKYPEHSPAPQTVLDGCPVDVVLKEGEVLGGRLKVFSTPGHDSEAISLLDVKTNALFTGDTLQFLGMAGAEGAAGLAFVQYLGAYRDTIQKIRKIGPDYLFAAHDYIPFGFMSEGKKEVELNLRVCEDVIGIYDVLVRRELAAGNTDTASIAANLCRRLGAEVPAKLFMAMYTVDEHRKEIGL